jgi:hypothetical protein
MSGLSQENTTSAPRPTPPRRVPAQRGPAAGIGPARLRAGASPASRTRTFHVPEKLAALHELFLSELRAADPDLASRYAAWKAEPAGLEPKALSDAIVRLAPYVSRFVARLFRIEAEREALRARVLAHDPVFRFKIDFVRRRALTHLKSAADIDAGRLREAESSSRRCARVPRGPSMHREGRPGESRFRDAHPRIGDARRSGCGRGLVRGAP